MTLTQAELAEFHLLTAELRTTSKRLRALSIAAQDCMEGADMPESSICEELWQLDEPARHIAAIVSRINKRLNKHSPRIQGSESVPTVMPTTPGSG